jgi:hypothetical protein
MKVFLFLFTLLGLPVADTPIINISTTMAMEKYEHLLKNRSFLVYPEFRENPIKWYDSIPENKIVPAMESTTFTMKAAPGEYFVFQLGVWALKKDLSNVKIEYQDLKAENGKSVAARKITCFNAGGVDIKGDTFLKEINISAGRIQALWMVVDLEGVTAGAYSGSVTVLANGDKQIVPLQLEVSGEAVVNHGYDEGKRLSRLNWLNSTVGIDEEVTKGFLPIEIKKRTISILGRTLTLDRTGLPASIVSFFSPSNQSLVEKGKPIIDTPFRFVIELTNGKVVRMIPGNLVVAEQTPSKVVWRVLNTSEVCDLEIAGQMEFDGFVDYKLTLTAKVPLQVKDIRLDIAVVKEKAEYMMGLGHEGGLRVPDWTWKWDAAKNQDMLWMGAVNGGLRVKWKGSDYVRPLVNIYYAFGPLNMPRSWTNDGLGGVNVMEQNGEVLMQAYSGAREMQSGEKLNYDFELLITPFRTIDKKIQFDDRYYHGGGTITAGKVSNAKKVGANIINIHHAEDIYPFINYPYLDANAEELTGLVSEAHKEGLRMKFYYTTRELTKNLPEFWAFNSLNGEVIFPGPGNASRTEALHPKGPNEWLIKNMREKYIPAWYNKVDAGKFKGETDISVITTPDSRLNNFYIAGLDWMVQKMGVDGVYIDDSALDRYTLLRARKVIDKFRPEGRMDLHSWNHFNSWAGFANCLNMYMDLLPYFDLVWIGEGRDYDRMPDHWLVEVSGIPFGLPGQMLERGGHPWRGMVYGLTNRAGWTKNSPEHLWKFFDEYRFSEKEMIGYWEKDIPVQSGNSAVKATVYRGHKEFIIAVANWREDDQVVSLDIDWKRTGLNPATAVIKIPEIKDFQTEETVVALDKIVIPASRGYLIVIKDEQ